MKAVRVHKFGGPDALTYENAPDPAAPGPGQALIDMKIIGINFSDTNYRRGLGPAAGMALPLTPGHEGTGIVAAIGADVTNVRVGDRVVFAGQHRFGGGSDYDCDPHVLDLIVAPGSGGEDEIKKQHEILGKYKCAATPAGSKLAILPMVYPGS